MVDKLVFHIGDHKTGSTAIQTTLAMGAYDLRGRKIFYPTKLNHNSLVKKFKNHGNFTKNGRSNREFIKKLSQRIARSDDDLCVISGEVFENLSPNILADTVEKFFSKAAREIQIIAYVRPHAARILSSFAEQTKIGWFQGDLEEFTDINMKSGRFEYAPRFNQLRKRFGHQFLLRPSIRDRLWNSSVVDDFFFSILGDAEFSLGVSMVANESLSLENLALIRTIHSRLQTVPRWTRHAFGWQFLRIMGADGQKGTRPALHRALAERIRKHYAADAAAMDRSFFEEQVILSGELDQAVQNAIDEAQPIDVFSYFSDQEYRRISAMADMMAIMLERDNSDPRAWARYLRSIGREGIKRK